MHNAERDWEWKAIAQRSLHVVHTAKATRGSVDLVATSRKEGAVYEVLGVSAIHSMKRSFQE